MSEYWVYRWLDERRVRSIDDVGVSLASKSAIEELKESADLVLDSWRASPVNPRPLSLVAGAGIDLSGRLDCNASSCRRAQVDRLFRSVWHYFETVVARDAIAEDLVVHRSCPDAEIRERLLPHLETVLIVRELGAEALVEFLPRVPACSKHWQQHAREGGIEDIAKREAEIVNQLVPDTEIHLEQEEDGVLCMLNNPDFSHSQWVHFSKTEIKRKSREQLKRLAVQRVARMFLVHLTADVIAAKKYGGALGSTIPMFQKLLANRGEKVSDVAFQLELPVLEGMSVGQLIETRLRYQDTFTRFRKRINSFIEECVRQGIIATADIRAKLKADLIEGELEELKSNLKQAEDAFRRKSAYALTLGSLVVTIGVTTGILTAPIAFSLGASILAGSLGPGVSKYIDDKVKIKSDDLYFLLQAESHRH